MRIDIEQLSSQLASDTTISDYDFWRALKTIDNELYRIERQRRPIGIEIVFARAIIRNAQRKRKAA